MVLVDSRLLVLSQRLNDINTELTGLHRENATLLKAEREAFRNGWRNTTEGTVSGREAMAKDNAADLKIERIPVEGDIASLTEERDHIRFVIKYGLWRDQ